MRRDGRRCRRKLLLPLAGLLCVIGGIVIGRAWQMRLPLPQTVVRALYVERRGFALDKMAAKAPPGLVLLVGDSISEFAWIPSLCGRPVFNAGISAARVRDMIRPAASLARRLSPSHIVIALGANDARPRATGMAEFRRDYEALLDGLGPAPKTLVGVMQLDPAHPEHGGWLNTAAVDAENRIIREIARRRDARFVPAPLGVSTDDGIHPTAAGSRTWLAAIARYCPTGDRPTMPAAAI